MGNVEVPTAALYGSIDKCKSNWSAKESAANKLKSATSAPQQAQAETAYRQAEADYDGKVLDIVVSLRDYYEMPRIRDWKILLGNAVSADLRLSASSLAKQEALMVELGKLDLDREVDNQVSNFFTLG